MRAFTFDDDDRLLAVVTKLMGMRREGRIPALFVESGRIYIEHPPGQTQITERRRLSLSQAERLAQGVPLSEVLNSPTRPSLRLIVKRNGTQG